MKHYINKKLLIVGLSLTLLVGIFMLITNVTASSLINFSYSSTNYYVGQSGTYTFTYTTVNTVQADDYIASIVFPIGFNTSGVVAPAITVTVDDTPANVDFFDSMSETGALISIDTAVMPGSVVSLSIPSVFNTSAPGAHSFQSFMTKNISQEEIDSVIPDQINIIEQDFTSPTIMSINSSTADGTYTIGDVIDIIVTFSEVVGEGDESTTLTFETGDVDQSCIVTFAGDNTATCSITIVTGDTTADLSVSNISSKAVDESLNIIGDVIPATNLDVLKNIAIDTTNPVVTITDPASSSTIDNVTNNSDITFTTDKALASGTLILTRISGTADASSPRTCTLVGNALLTGSHTLDLSDTTNSCTNDISDLVSGTTYELVIEVDDTLGLPSSYTTSNITFTIDTIPPEIAITQPFSNSLKINNVTTTSDITVSNGELLSSGTLTITRTSGTADASSPRVCALAGSALTGGVHIIDLSTDCTANISDLVSGAVYTISFVGSDSNGNVTDPVTRTGITFDNIAPTLAITAPADSETIDDVTSASDISISHSETLTSGTLTFTRTDGTVDSNSPHVCTLNGTALDAGSHVIDLSDTTNSCVSDVSDLVLGTVYDITLSGTDTATNISSTALVESVLFQTDIIVPPNMDTDAPIIATVTPIASTVTESTAIYTFSTTEIGTLEIEVCNADITVDMSEISTSTITFSNMANDSVHECDFTITDAANNISNTLTVGPFTVLLSSQEDNVPEVLQSNQTGYIIFYPKITIPKLTVPELITNNLDNKKQCLVGSYLFSQKMKRGAVDGVFNEYTNAIAKEVKKLQAFMNNLGFKSGPEDGIFGPITESAVMRMQTIWEVKPDGIFGPKMQSLLLDPCIQTVM